MRRLITSLALLTLAACGGGGGGSSSNTLSGTAATGAPLSGASIEVYNSSGIKVATATADSSGKYTSSALLGEGPYVIKATSGTTELYSVQSSADGSVVNVTPLSNLVATLLSPTGNAGNLVSEFGTDKTLLSSTGINDKKTIVKSIAAPVANVISGIDANFDVINTAMVANGTGLDQVLDTVHVAITHDSTSSSIQVVYKTANGDSSPQTITFSNSDTRSNVIASVNGVTYTSGDIFDSKQMQKIQVWIKRNNDCHKLSPSERWSGTAGSKVVQASICKKLFYNDDQANVKVNGSGVEAAFTGLFSNKTWTTDVLSETEYVYSTADGEVLAKTKAAMFNEDGTAYTRYFFFNLSPDPNNNNELRAQGNGYDYEVNVNNVNYIRYYPYSPGYDFTYSGYGFDIPTLGTHASDSTPSVTYTSPVKQAEVTSPSGEVTYMYNVRSRAWLSACVSKPTDDADALNKCADSPYKIINAKFFDRDTNLPSVPSGAIRSRPSEYAYSGFVDYGPTNGQLTDTQIKNLPALGTYKVKLTLTNGNTKDLRVPFYGRPKTHNEIIKSKATGLFPAFKTSFIAGLFKSINDLGADDGHKNVFPLKWNDAKTDVDILPYFETSWTGLAQWIYMSGTQVDTTTANTNWKDFGLRQVLSSSESSKKIYCSKSGTTDPCDSSGAFSWYQSNFGSVFSYMEIGNYFSDFGVNITAYGFTDFENSAANPYKP